MNYIEKNCQLREEINKQLLPLIDADYAYLELPYYENIGDTLIWEGTRLFLAQTRFKCLYSASFTTFYYHRLPPTAIILLQGGGNFGDLWEGPHPFRRKVIDLYPNNRIIVLPQTVWYENEHEIVKDEILFAAHPNVTLCARDKVSYEFMRKHFKENRVLLVPDMAFFIDLEKHGRVAGKMGRTLYAKRTDKELKTDGAFVDIPLDAEVHDWPTCEKKEPKYFIADCLEGVLYYSAKVKGFSFINRLRDFLRVYYYRPQYLKDGVQFVGHYDIVYATRLHIALMAAMMGRCVHLLDNSYGKNFSFYDTWLTDMDNVVKT